MYAPMRKEKMAKSNKISAKGSISGILGRAARFWALGGTLAALLCLAGTGSARAEEIRVDLMAPLTGKWASEDEDARKAITLLIEQWNASGLPGNRVLRLDVQDDAKEKYRTPPLSGWAMLSADALNVAAAAVAAGHVTPEAMAYWSHEPRQYAGITGNVSFDAKGDREGDLYHIYEVDAEGRFLLADGGTAR